MLRALAVSPDPLRLVVHVPRAAGAYAELAGAAAVVVDGHFGAEDCARWVAGTYAARDAWTHDFGGEQYALGRAFYTHYEEGRSAAYFEGTAASDARVEEAAPGLQAAMRDLAATVLGARVVPRRGWCGPGVHVFPPGGPVATRGGVVHFDTEGLAARHVERGGPAITLVAMLQPAEGDDGGLAVWAVRHRGHDHPTAEELAAPREVVSYRTGDVVLIDSYRLHQIQPFSGDRDRISATVHAAETSPGMWECWF